MQMQLTLWDLIEEASETPSNLALTNVWRSLDQTIAPLPIDQQLQVAAEAIARLAASLNTRAEFLLKDWDDRHNLEGPEISTDLFAGLVRLPIELDLSDLKASPEPPPVSKRKRKSAPEDSVVGLVPKANALAFAEAMTLDNIRELASEEDVERWTGAIAQHLDSVGTAICLTDLQQALGMPLVEVWMGLLLGGFALKQEGGFYSQDVWVGFPSKC